MSDTITLATAAALTGLTKRTLRRWMAEGSTLAIRGAPRGPYTVIELAPLLVHVGVALAPEDLQIVLAADRGDHDAENDIGLRFYTARRFRQAAMWFERAAAGGNADAMHWLGRCCIAGEGMAVNRHRGLGWLARSAEAGHAISTEMLDRLSADAVGRASPVTRGRHGGKA